MTVKTTPVQCSFHHTAHAQVTIIMDDIKQRTFAHLAHLAHRCTKFCPDNAPKERRCEGEMCLLSQLALFP